MLKAPFRLEEGWLRQFGYPGERRLVALYWEPCGDEACYDDGISNACGLCDNRLYLGFIHQQHVYRWLEEHSLNLGNSDEAWFGLLRGEGVRREEGACLASLPVVGNKVSKQALSAHDKDILRPHGPRLPGAYCRICAGV